MAAIALSDCTVRNRKEGEWETYKITTPATADSADTVDVSSLAQGRTIGNVSGWDETGEESVTATSSSGVITLDAAGGTTNHTYTITVDYRN